MTALRVVQLLCPGPKDCGLIAPVIEYRRMGNRHRPVMVCPECGTRLLPTPAEISRTRVAKLSARLRADATARGAEAPHASPSLGQVGDPERERVDAGSPAAGEAA